MAHRPTGHPKTGTGTMLTPALCSHLLCAHCIRAGAMLTLADTRLENPVELVSWGGRELSTALAKHWA